MNPPVPRRYLGTRFATILLCQWSVWLLAQDPQASLESLLNQARQSYTTASGSLTPANAQNTPDPQSTQIAERLSESIQRIRTQAASGISSPVRSAAPSLTLASGSRTRSVYLRQDGTVRHLSILPGPRPAPAAAVAPTKTSEAVAREFFQRNAQALKLDAPEQELVLMQSHRDSEGLTHLRFNQVYQGLPVWPSGALAHFNSDNQLIGVDGAYHPTPSNVALVPTLSGAIAAQRAKARFPAAWVATHTEPELILYAPMESPPRLGWKFDLSIGISKAWRVVVDAHNGRLLHHSTRIFDANVAGTGIDQTGTARALNVWQQGNTYYLLDTSKPMYVPGADPITNPKGVIAVHDARSVPVDQLGDNNLFEITSTSPKNWAVPSGVSAAFNFSQTYDYYRERHDRNSLDNQGGNILAIVRVGNYDNASWHGNLGLMLFGDVRPYAASLDVVGHELSHGVTEKTAGLLYELESGALNEAFSDIFGEMVEARTRGVNDWLIGSELNQPFRNMKNPGAIQIGGLNRPYPARMSEFVQLPNTDDADHGGVHLNSSIINHCFYLLAEGLPGAIGRRDAERIFYRTLTEYLQAQSQFIDCRLGAIAAAEALFGKDSGQAKTTASAFDAVEVLAAPTTPDPTPVPVVQAADSTLFVYEQLFGFGLGRHESAQGDPSGGSVLASGIQPQRPAVTGDGSITLYVTDDHDLCVASTADPKFRQCLGLAGSVHSVAISPDGKFAAFVLRNAVTGTPEGRVTIANLDRDISQTVTLVAPAVDGASVDQVLYADSMAFSTDSQELIYDAVSRVKFTGGNTVERWSIYGLDITTLRTEMIVPPIEGIDSGNPAPGRAGTRYIAFDAKVEANGKDGIVVLDRFTGDVKVITVIEEGFGYPSFTGDERALVFSGPDGGIFSSGVSLFSQGLKESRLEPEGDRSLWQSDALLGVIYRRGLFQGTNALPSVSLTTAISGAAPATLGLTANAADIDGSVARVEFYNGATKLGEALSPDKGAFHFAWNGVAEGHYRLIARAFDNLGAAADSSPVEVTIEPAGGTASLGPFTATSLPTGAVRLSLQAKPGTYVVSRSQNLKDWTEVLSLTVGANGTGAIEDVAGPKNFDRLFYRVRSQ